jgi:hypothetical protein
MLKKLIIHQKEIKNLKLEYSQAAKKKELKSKKNKKKENKVN